ncbi:MAG: hypothetical protein F6K40_22000 [Okeania sp. SIO3I5]|uniref:hypothetical protein n=1 Tax=Okeania sp. SIO3I5 TaxID=2607805 RepID=UPI0013B95D98|nr:hypothetical protein [Okeania sp. SIO3I5]NEQ38796.1 hypothetical protein [Okeania sp. SIO3I5]
MGHRITASAKDEIKAGVFMETTAILNEAGELNVSTRSWTENLVVGAHSRAVIYLFDKDNKRLWNTDKVACGIGGMLEVTFPIFDRSVKSDRTENYSFKVPPDFVSQASSIRIVHFNKTKPFTEYLKILNKFFDMNEKSQNPTVYNTQNGDRIHISGGQVGAVGDCNTVNSTFTQNHQNLPTAVAEVRKIWHELSQTYPTNTVAEEIVVAAKTIEKIEANSTLKERLISAAKEGTLAAIKELPGGKVIVAAIEGWQKKP